VVLLASFVTLKILGADFAGDMATAMDLVFMVVPKGLEGEFAFRADGRLLLEDLLTTRGRHGCGRRDGRKCTNLEEQKEAC
jgi:hypothetical protein